MAFVDRAQHIRSMLASEILIDLLYLSKIWVSTSFPLYKKPTQALLLCHQLVTMLVTLWMGIFVITGSFF